MPGWGVKTKQEYKVSLLPTVEVEMWCYGTVHVTPVTCLSGIFGVWFYVYIFLWPNHTFEWI